MIIDFRVRPAFGGFRGENTFYTNLNFQIPFAKRFGFELPPSVLLQSIDLFLAEMDEAGIDKAVIPARRLYNVTNQALTDFIEHFPTGRFYGMASVDPMDGQAALDEIEQFVVSGPLSGVTLEPGYCAEPLMADDQRLYPLYEKCQRDNIPIFLSFGGLVAPYMAYNNPEIVDRVAVDFPDLKLILAHGGYPYVTQACYVAMNRKNVYLVPDFYATRVPGGKQYLEAAAWIPEKIIFGSGYPVQPIKGMLDYYRENLPADAFERITYKNAADILGI